MPPTAPLSPARRRLNKDSALRSFEHLLQLARLRRTHRVVIAADVVSADEDIWHGALLREAEEGFLYRGSVRDFVELDRRVLHTELIEETFGALA